MAEVLKFIMEYLEFLKICLSLVKKMSFGAIFLENFHTKLKKLRKNWLLVGKFLSFLTNLLEFSGKIAWVFSGSALSFFRNVQKKPDLSHNRFTWSFEEIFFIQFSSLFWRKQSSGKCSACSEYKYLIISRDVFSRIVDRPFASDMKLRVSSSSERLIKTSDIPVMTSMWGRDRLHLVRRSTRI